MTPRRAGLTISLVLSVTGSLIAWSHELTAGTAPRFTIAAPPAPVPPWSFVETSGAEW